MKANPKQSSTWSKNRKIQIKIEMNIETETGTNWEWETKQRSENIQKKYKSSSEWQIEKQKLASAKWTGIYKLNQNNEQRLTTVTDTSNV